MKWVSRLSMRAVIPFAVCCLLAASMGVARAGDKAQLGGNWTFNPDQSDDAQQKVQQAQQNSQRGSAAGGYPGSGSAEIRMWVACCIYDTHHTYNARENFERT